MRCGELVVRSPSTESQNESRKLTHKSRLGAVEDCD